MWVVVGPGDLLIPVSCRPSDPGDSNRSVLAAEWMEGFLRSLSREPAAAEPSRSSIVIAFLQFRNCILILRPSLLWEEGKGEMEPFDFG